jgi:L-fuculose-phosphate aldolase
MDKNKLRKELCEIGRKIAEKGLIIGAGGNISARLGDIVYMKASGISFEEACESHYIGVNLKTRKVVEGTLRPTSEILMHLGCYLARKDIGAVIHTHPPLANAFAMQGKVLKPFTPDFVAYVGSDIPVLGYVVPASKKVADKVKRVIRKCNGVLLANHGLVTTGANLKEAFHRTLLVEDACRTVISAKILGRMRFFTKKECDEIGGLEVEAYRRKLLRGK